MTTQRFLLIVLLSLIITFGPFLLIKWAERHDSVCTTDANCHALNPSRCAPHKPYCF